MSRCEITAVANAGVTVRMGRSLIFVDALHRRKVPGWSCVTEERWETLAGQTPPAGPDLIFFTHRHPDHYSQTLSERAAARWPGVRFILPEQVLPGQRLLSGRRETMSLPGVTVRFASLPHEGEQYAQVRHYGCILEHEGFRLLIPGDCALCAEELREFIAESGPVDAAILDFPWLTLPRGRKFVQEHMRPRYMVVNHLPFEGDDLNGYRAAAIRSASLIEGPEVRLLLEPFQREIIN